LFTIKHVTIQLADTLTKELLPSNH